MKTRRLLLIGIGVLGLGTLLGIPVARRTGFLPARWEVTERGPIEGVEWRRFPGPEARSKAGEITRWSRHASNPNDFVFRIPDPNDEVKSFVVVDGHEVPIENGLFFRDPHYRSAQPIREYPPNLDHLELVVKTKAGTASRFVVRDLPPTRYRFPVDGPEVRTQTVDGVQFESAAWTEAPKPNGYPYIAGAVRIVDGLPPGDWEWRDVSFEPPFQSAEAPVGSPGRMSGRLRRENPAVGATATHPWASSMSRVRLQGRIAEFAEVRETVDFGEFDVDFTTSWADNDFALKFTKPIERTTPKGVRLRIEPVTRHNQSHGKPIPSKLHLRLTIEPGTERNGLPEALKNAKGEMETVFASAPHGEPSWLASIKPDDGAGPNLFLTYPGLKPGRLRLKVEINRRIATREIPFALTPDVRPRLHPPASTRWMKNASGPTTGSFDPKPEDFPARLAAHN
ncbi:MAG: hypothetical protein ACO1SV_04735 [Fimbriimonas sp.]